MSESEIDLDSIIDRLLEGKIKPTLQFLVEMLMFNLCLPFALHPMPSVLISSWDIVRGNRPGKPVQLQENELKYLCTTAREIFISQPILLELEAPIKICGMYARDYTSNTADLTVLCYLVRGYSWPVLRSPPPVRVRRLPARKQLSVSRRLRR